jgi:Ca-activated chloride channel family protein
MNGSLQLWGVTIAYPWVLLLLLLLPILMFFKGRIGGNPAVRFSSTKILMTASRKRSTARMGAILPAIFFLSLALLIFAAARPQFGRSVTRVHASGVDIMLALDVSGSMKSEDMSIGGERSNRLDAVKAVTQSFISNRPNDRIGVLAFAGRPYLISPPTLDHDWLIANLDRIQVGMVEDSTAIGSAIAAAARRLQARSSKSKILVLLTDGANNAGRISPFTAAEAAKALGIKIYTIGAGSDGPVPYPVRTPFGSIQYQLVEFDTDISTLKKIAAATSGQFFRAADGQSLVKIFRDIDRMEKSKAEVTKISLYKDLFPWFVSAAFALICVELLLSQTLWRRLP